MVKYNYMNYIKAKNTGDKLGHSGCYGGQAETPEEALQYAMKRAKETRKIMGFPIDIEIKLEFTLEL